ncbi:hypothetical protein MC885_015676, partial [Smutsia gigantea]
MLIVQFLWLRSQVKRPSAHVKYVHEASRPLEAISESRALQLFSTEFYFLLEEDGSEGKRGNIKTGERIVINTLKVSSASRTMHSRDYLQLKYSYQQVAHVRTSSPEHQQPVINQAGLLLKFSAMTETLKDTRKGFQSGVRG